ncbi:MAG: hypothetical protein HYR60_12980 [Acidobacteria bacterium]|nr:hypothetical protein [Acidobacteriota bacterium]MBI3472254.1 hypothetical protein [Candidatus Solibacter usitatus]
MRLAVFAVLLLAVTLPAADKKRKAPKPPDIEVLECTAQRASGKVSVDGRVRNTSVKVIRGLILVFDFMADGRAVITTQKGAVDEEALQPGQEAPFRMELVDPVRAVEVQVNAVDEQARDLRVAKAGPFPIE